MQAIPQQWITTAITVAVAIVVIGLRMRRMARVMPLKVERLWILPAAYAAIVAVLLWSHPPHGLTWLYMPLALAVGSVVGWYRGKLMTIAVDPETHSVTQQGSIWAMLFIAVLVGIRIAGRTMIQVEGNGNPETVIALTDVLLAFGLGFIALQRVEMGLRARAMLAAVRGAPR